MTFSLHIKDYNTFALLSNKQIYTQTTDSRGYVSFEIKESERGDFFRVELVNDSTYKPQAFNIAGEVGVICTTNALHISNTNNLSIAFLHHKYKIQNFLAMFYFYCIAIFLCFSTPLLAGSDSLILNPMKAEYFAKGQECDITKKGNICEITFRMPLDLWRVWVKNNQHIDIVLYFYTETPDYWHNFSFDDKKLGFTTLPIQNASDFISRLYEVWNPNKVYYHWTPEHLKAITHLLESYHPNQFFKLKVTFTPLSHLKEQQEVTDIFSLYKTESSRILRGLMQIKSVKTWKKYKIRLEVLEDATLPQGVKTELFVSGSSIK